MAYDWTGERTRKIQRIKITIATIAALVAIAAVSIHLLALAG